MKTYLPILPLIAGILVCQTYAQQQTSDRLEITTPVDYVESNIDRTVTLEWEQIMPPVIDIGNPDASYTGTNINITGNSPDSYIEGIVVNGKYINLTTSGEGVWNTITITGATLATGISIINTSQTSYISNTELNIIGGNTNGLVNQSGQALELDNVNINIDSYNNAGIGLSLYGGGIITNQDKGQVSITGGGIVTTSAGGTIDLYNATINVTDNPSPASVLASSSLTGNASISLTNSSIASTDGNMFIASFYSTATAIFSVNLDNVNLDNAKNQLIIFDKSLTVNLSNDTNFDGHTAQYMTGMGSLNLTITSGASWNVTQDSTMGTASSLSLGADSTISFVSTAGADTFADDFTNINSAAVMLAEGSILKLDKNAAAFEEGDVITLFTGADDDTFTNDGAILVTADGQQLDYLDLDNGSFQILGIIIPEPATATLGLAALGLLAFRRKN